jgi:hypothetical protein
LIHFVLAKNDDPKVSLYHYFISLESFIKLLSIAPISVLFSDFTFKNLVQQTCKLLVQLFPHSLFLQSALLKITLSVPTATALCPEPEQQQDDSDSSDTWSDLQGIQAPALSLALSHHSDCCQSPGKLPTFRLEFRHGDDRRAAKFRHIHSVS